MIFILIYDIRFYWKFDKEINEPNFHFISKRDWTERCRWSFSSRWGTSGASSGVRGELSPRQHILVIFNFDRVGLSVTWQGSSYHKLCKRQTNFDLKDISKRDIFSSLSLMSRPSVKKLCFYLCLTLAGLLGLLGLHGRVLTSSQVSHHILTSHIITHNIP